MNALRSAVLAGCFTALTACTIKTNAPGTAGDMAGNWSGTYVDSKTNTSGSISANFTESNDSLGGSLTVGAWACSIANQGTVTGTANGDSVSVSATFGFATALTFSGTVASSKFSGTYTITSGVCAGSTGTFSLTQ